MSGGAELFGGEVAVKRPRGRPKGSGNKRAKDLKGYVAARFGGSAAQQMAAVCMVTPKEVREAGSVLEARLVKARELAAELGCTTKEAWDLISKELAALAPYTDQRQPLAVEQVGERAPAVVFMGAAPIAHAAAEIVGEFQVIDAQVSRPKSHAEGQAAEITQLPLAAPADDKSAGPPGGG